MFTGIIQAVGHIDATEARGADARLRIAAGDLDLADVRVGDSIAVSGVCLTVVELGDDAFSADVSAETLGCTTLGRLHAGRRVNLEKALAYGDRLGGHLVSGHVDGVARVRTRRQHGRSVEFRITAPTPLEKYIAAKGAVCLDGVSLTVNRVEDAEFEVNIVPHTLQATTLDELVPGAEVNLEVDLLARYLERLLHGHEHAGINRGFTAELLARADFTK